MTTAEDFDPADPGTLEVHWRNHFASSSQLVLDIEKYRNMVVVAAHPDDEVLGCGGLIHRALSSGATVTVILATWGEASHPSSNTISPAALGLRRQNEMRSALAALESDTGATIDLTALGFPDGRVDAYRADLTAAIVDAVMCMGGSTLIVAPWRHDGHPDHVAAGMAAAAAAARAGCVLGEYPIWFWHWGTPEQLPRTGVAIHRLSAAEHSAKQSGISCHVSQVRRLSDEPGDTPILPAHVLDHFDRDFEVVILDPTPTDVSAFDELHRRHRDPWRVSSGYEVAKRRATLALLDDLPRPHRVLEIGCSVGALAGDLADMCDYVDAIDPALAAVEAARRRTSEHRNVTVSEGWAPDHLPTGPYDLVVLSEVGYYLSASQLARTLSVIQQILSPGGYLVACHWSHPIRGWPLDGAAVHAAIDSTSHLEIVDAAHDPDYLLGLWRHRSSPSSMP